MMEVFILDMTHLSLHSNEKVTNISGNTNTNNSNTNKNHILKVYIRIYCDYLPIYAVITYMYINVYTE